MPTMIRITARIGGFRRAGIAHPAAPVDHPAEAFTHQQLCDLHDEPMLVVQEIEVPDPDPKPADKKGTAKGSKPPAGG